MDIGSQLTDEAVLGELGRRLRQRRLERNLSQLELAAEAGVERKAVQRIEAGESVRVASLVRVLRALGLLEALDRLLPEPVPSPIELVKLRGKRRERATGSRGGGRPASEPGAAPWRWGDERSPREQ
jgi:transcriptional regulator with XRE-family HTH domain